MCSTSRFMARCSDSSRWLVPKPAMPKIRSIEILFMPIILRCLTASSASAPVCRRFMNCSTLSSNDCMPRLTRFTDVDLSAATYSSVMSSGFASMVISSTLEQSNNSWAWFMSCSISWGATSDGVPPPKYIDVSCRSLRYELRSSSSRCILSTTRGRRSRAPTL